ncbi:putative phosphoesterase [Acholeplasma morum]|uniref:metallophosphoesterase family protein n=1 Tax=Paracholeplasma morum TaxID=264637 RepID=UPI001958A797|nr:YfcE family phosphodiesterase [Paracholeplasma morum]MBM7453769.1 putative phosphoesterase [Paracholeplasma morum]
MKILITSDAHGRFDRLSMIQNLHSDRDLHLDAGDLVITQREYDQLHIEAVSGNADRFLELPIHIVKTIDHKRFLVLHGHTENVKYGLDKLIDLALNLKVDYVIYGHTHVQKITNYKNIILINPGAISNIIPEYAIYEDGQIVLKKGV